MAAKAEPPPKKEKKTYAEYPSRVSMLVLPVTTEGSTHENKITKRWNTSLAMPTASLDLW